MLLLDIVGSMAAIAVASAVALQAAGRRTSPAARSDWVPDRVALVLVIAVTFLISVRSRIFGVDTAAY